MVSSCWNSICSVWGQLTSQDALALVRLPAWRKADLIF